MARAIAPIRDNRQRVPRLHVRAIRRRHILRNDHTPVGQLAQRAPRKPQQIVQNSLRNIAYVPHAPLEILILELGKKLDVALRHQMKTVLNVKPLRVQRLERLADQRRIIERKQMRVKYRRLTLPEPPGNHIAQLQNLPARLQQRLLKPTRLAIQHLHGITRHINRIVQKEKRHPLRHARRGSDALD